MRKIEQTLMASVLASGVLATAHTDASATSFTDASERCKESIDYL